MHNKFACGALCMGLAFLSGCQSPRPSQLPTYFALTAPAALEILARRANAIHTFTARCELILTGSDRQAIQLDGLMVLSPPDRLRLRVWKLGQAVFDLTLLPDGLWVETSPDAERHGPVVPAALSAAQLAHFLTWFEGGFFTAPGLKAPPPQDAALVFRRDLEDGTSIVCDVDRATATPQKFRLIDAAGNLRFSLSMSDYTSTSGILWPTRLSALATNSAGGGNRIDIIFSDIAFNEEPAPGAFVPPRNAEKQP